MAKKVKDPPKSSKGFVPGRNANPADLADYYSQNLDNPDAYLFDEIFSSPGQVAGIYQSFRDHSGEGWQQRQSRFLENVDRYSPYLYGMRQADLTKPDTDVNNPGIVGLKDFPNPGGQLKRTDPRASKWLKTQKFTDPKPGKSDPHGKYSLYHVVPEGVQKRPATKDQYIAELAEGGEVGGGEIDTAALAELGSEQLSELLGSILSTGAGKLQGEIDAGIRNPTEAMEKLDKRAVAGDIGKTVLSDAAKGFSIAGPWGALGGAIVGGVRSGAKAIAGHGDRVDARNEARGAWSTKWAGSAERNLVDSGYAEGGKIKGKGTAKSDDIRMKAPEGSFIVPAENSSAAMQYGKDYLGWNDKEIASRNYGNVDINVSNGEVFYTPEEYEVLAYYGVDVDGLAPDAEKNNTGFCRGGKTKGYQDGGGIPPEGKTTKLPKGYKGVRTTGEPYGETTLPNPFNKDPRVSYLPPLGIEGLISTKTELAESIKDRNPEKAARLMSEAKELRTGLDTRPKMGGKYVDVDAISYHDGGGVHSHPHMDAEGLNAQNQEKLERDINDPLNTYIANSMAEIDKDVQGQTFRKVQKVDIPEEETALQKILRNAGVIAGAAQVAGGAAGLIAAGKRPDVNVSSTLKSISRTARESAGYGLPPAAKNALKNERERILKSTMNEISSKGGSAQEIHSKMMSALSKSLSAAEKTELVDYQAREEKVKRSQAIDMKIGDQEFDIEKIGLASWEKDQDVWANLISAGISNTIGAKQFNDQLNWMKENTDRSINFTLPS